MHIAGSPDRLQQLRDLTFANTKDPTALSNELATLQATPLPASASAQSFAQWLHTEEVQTLLSDLRKSQPSSYDVLLRETKMWMSRGFRKSTRSRVAAWLVPMALLLLAGVGVWMIASNAAVALTYSQWRFTKGNASAKEHFRAQEYLLGRIGQAAQNANGRDEIAKIISPLALKLPSRKFRRGRRKTFWP